MIRFKKTLTTVAVGIGLGALGSGAYNLGLKSGYKEGLKDGFKTGGNEVADAISQCNEFPKTLSFDQANECKLLNAGVSGGEVFTNAVRQRWIQNLRKIGLDLR